MKNKKIISLCILLTMVFSLFTVEAGVTTNPTLTVGQMNALPGETVEVPITLSGNTGICGATICVHYDNALVLTGITKGEAFSTLTLTKPGKLSANPVKIVWDGMEEDATNGVIATLTFTVPDLTGTYPISLSYEEGDIMDGNISPVAVDAKSGGITVGDEQPEENGPVIRVGSATAMQGETVEVPLILSGNTGICGVTLCVHYDNALALTGITKGEAFSTLTLTKPGKLSANPVKIVWDGMEEDTTNGVIAILTFTAPNMEGTYPISLSYEEGDIMDGNITPVEVGLKDGEVEVESAGVINIEVMGNKVAMTNESEKEGTIFIAYYQSENQLFSVDSFNPADGDIKIDNISKGVVLVKIMWWDELQLLNPICDLEKIRLQ